MVRNELKEEEEDEEEEREERLRRCLDAFATFRARPQGSHWLVVARNGRAAR
jgi:hypothetical protein